MNKIIEDYKALLKSFDERLDTICKLYSLGRYPSLGDITSNEVQVRFETGCGCHPDSEAVCWPISYFDGSMTPEEVVNDLKIKQAEKEFEEKKQKEIKKMEEEKEKQERKRKKYEELKKEFEG